MSLNDSDKLVKHYKCPQIISKFANVFLSIYLSIPTTLPSFTWITINCHISPKVVLFPILIGRPWQGLNHKPSDLQSPALPSELSAIDQLCIVSNVKSLVQFVNFNITFYNLASQMTMFVFLSPSCKYFLCGNVITFFTNLHCPLIKY